MAIFKKARECTGTFVCRFRVALLVAAVLLAGGILIVVMTTEH